MCKQQSVTKYLVTWFTGILSARVIVQYTNNRQKTLDTSPTKDNQQPLHETTIINPVSNYNHQPRIKDNQQPLHETTIINPVSNYNQQPLHETTIINPVSKTIDNPVSKTIINLCMKPQSTTSVSKTINNLCMKPQSSTSVWNHNQQPLHETTINPSYKFY